MAKRARLRRGVSEVETGGSLKLS